MAVYSAACGYFSVFAVTSCFYIKKIKCTRFCLAFFFHRNIAVINWKLKQPGLIFIMRGKKKREEKWQGRGLSG